MTARTALVVGGTSGIGLATARQLQALSHEVHVAGRSRQTLDGLAESDPGLIRHHADGGDRDRMAAVAEEIGSIDWLVLTLSGSEGQGPIADLDLGTLRRAFDAKLWAQLTTIQAVLPRLTADGSITVLGAITARMGMAGTAGLAALNGAIEALVKPLAIELAPIRVNGVSPGLVDTPWWSALPEEARQDYFAAAAKALPVGHVASADELAEVVVLAATNGNLTGTVLEADGGARLITLG
ncbi:NAD(P)-dependent dehydrogenase (short-subunit alcohol dehydrogenase family) [Kribbella sp. VKM Ac-2527]|uniref:NAD(P)-dependent dehydrogenase (Short-subunit alcohol dehydrogenase family) n=1 Tax=Kribbella caucasensis TaxID=2512215 RepID=A0A4R6JH29_9ACTN|nr:SDR family oxidoreductase [Kribbella sp. VKM Ac-2527]TDO33865.1 NAD(P)-dependent dehydrogenase (short-subunit alcohol dehydrogenase family) [Kribbella sp. VKM Ac-2527]